MASTFWGEPPDYLYGALPNSVIGDEILHRDYVACAAQHCGAKSVYKLDVSNFFENIHRDFVKDVFSKLLSFPDEVSEYLTDICCRGDFLLQGALTSSYIATACFWDIEGSVVEKLRRRNLRYTRLIDDITVSSTKSNYDFSYPGHHIQNMLIEKDLPINKSKSSTHYSGMSPLIVHGLRVDFKEPRLPSEELANIRTAVHNVIRMASINNYRTSKAYRESYDRCMGRVNKLSRVGHIKHKEYVNKLVKIKPLPSPRDIEKVKRSLKIMENKPKANRVGKKYIRRFEIAKYRISIIRRSFDKTADNLTMRLKNVSPYNN